MRVISFMPDSMRACKTAERTVVCGTNCKLHKRGESLLDFYRGNCPEQDSCRCNRGARAEASEATCML